MPMVNFLGVGDDWLKWRVLFIMGVIFVAGVLVFLMVGVMVGVFSFIMAGVLVELVGVVTLAYCMTVDPNLKNWVC